MNRKLVVIGMLVALSASAAIALADDRPHDGRDYHERHDDRDYHQYRGYRETPYDRGRHYGHHKHRERNYAYRGHWRSWDEWDAYLRHHPDIRRHGHYYREGVHLMFRSCPSGGDACIYFSIGR